MHKVGYVDSALIRRGTREYVKLLDIKNLDRCKDISFDLAFLNEHADHGGLPTELFLFYDVANQCVLVIAAGEEMLERKGFLSKTKIEFFVVNFLVRELLVVESQADYSFCAIFVDS